APTFPSIHCPSLLPARHQGLAAAYSSSPTVAASPPRLPSLRCLSGRRRRLVPDLAQVRPGGGAKGQWRRATRTSSCRPVAGEAPRGAMMA
uniref:Uncharacterized protein n=1 Tax=Aegilops tauschii subsp. strangulata TaxID=200361 RepID=A0A453MUA6_AEGTS